MIDWSEQVILYVKEVHYFRCQFVVFFKEEVTCICCWYVMISSDFWETFGLVPIL